MSEVPTRDEYRTQRRVSTRALNEPRARGRYLRLWFLTPVLVCVLVLAACGRQPDASPPQPAQVTPTVSPTEIPRSSIAPGLERARELLGEPRSGLPWQSGVWPGGDSITGARADAFGAWRGTPADAATTYPASKTWQSIHDSTWHITTYDGFGGVLSYGLPMLPTEEKGGDFASIIRGDHDWVYRKVAHDLVSYGRGTSIVRIGWEANGDWFPWNTTAKNAAEYRDAYRHIAAIFRAEAPNIVLDFDVACGTKMRGQKDRLDSLNLLYPGDDVVDLVGCDTYDWYHTKATDEGSWEHSIRPVNAAGIGDVAEFARAHGKGFTVPEWGLASRSEGGEGDNPYYMKQMRAFFEANEDVLVLESYFNEPLTSIANSIWEPVQAPRSAKVYQELW